MPSIMLRTSGQSSRMHAPTNLRRADVPRQCTSMMSAIRGAKSKTARIKGDSRGGLSTTAAFPLSSKPSGVSRRTSIPRLRQRRVHPAPIVAGERSTNSTGIWNHWLPAELKGERRSQTGRARVHLATDNVQRRISQMERRVENVHHRLSRLGPRQVAEAQYARTLLSVLERSLDLLYRERSRLTLSRRTQVPQRSRLQRIDLSTRHNREAQQAAPMTERGCLTPFTGTPCGPPNRTGQRA